MTRSTAENVMIADSPAMRELLHRMRATANSRAPVFITGETGTGKELCAATIHAMSPRAAGPFVALNCGAIPRDLVESELFGHIKGSFTGAVADRQGAAALAQGGTLFLDEICEMDPAQQVKLLRFLQSGTIQPVGSAHPQHVDARIICATNRDPRAEVRTGSLREDLYFRLHVLPVHLPPLRDRGTDILELAHSFLRIYVCEEHKEFKRFDASAEAALMAYSWPGNVRELQNVIRQAIVLNDGDVLRAEMLFLPAAINPPAGELCGSRDIDGLRRMHAAMSLPPAFHGRELWRIEREVIEETVAACGGSVPRAAKILGVSPSTLYRKRESWELPNRH
jgi:two-component system, repressor protein LuxO